MSNVTLEMLSNMIGSSVAQVSGKITDLFKYSYKDEGGEKGESSFQPGKFKLDSGETVAVVFYDQYKSNGGDMAPWKNKQITIESVKGTKGLSGIKVGEYKEKPQLQIKDNAILTEINGAPAAPQRPDAARTSASPSTAAAKPALDEKGALLAAKKFVARNGTLCKIAFAAVESFERQYIVEQHAKGNKACIGFPESTFNHLLTAHLFGSSHNGWYDGLPLNVKYPTSEIIHTTPAPEGAK